MEEEGDRHWSTGMVLRLLAAVRNPVDSGLAPWVRSLPARVDTPLLQYTNAELLAAKDPDILKKAKVMRQLHKVLFQEVREELSAMRLRRKDYFWAVSILHSRCFWSEGRHILVPGIDMVNHSFEPTANVRVSRKACPGRAAVEDVREPLQQSASRFELVAGDDGIQ